ncbi:MAG: TetR/AcrR family transcriptional regulator [Myxococcota bacterium]|nr:hypothetical protein [Spirochaeta sp.]RPG12960.1 MAG: TetR/AcrR family transcriptional regulator [Proteobacteria bacterium TMED72]
MSEPLERRVDDLKRSPAAQRRCDRALDSFIDLVLEGNLPPTPQQIAERAGISIATFFRYFENLNAMRQQAAERMLERFPLFEIPDPGEGSLSDRVDRFVSLRVALWEKVNLLARLQRTVVLEDPDAASMVNSVRQAMVDQIREHFAPELRGMSSSRREGAVAVIATLTSVESWEQFRETYGRSVRQTRRGWVDAVTAALGEASVR